MVQNESEHLSPATYRQRLIASDIASDIAGASLATVQFFSHTLFSLATFWRGGGGRRERRKALAMGRRGRKKALAMGREVERKKINERKKDVKKKISK